MKGIFKNIGFIALVPIIGFAMAACGDSGGSPIGDSCLTHAYGEWSQKAAATCTAAKIEKRICGTCNNEETRNVDSELGHLSNSWKWTTTYNSSNGHVSCTRSGCPGGFAEKGDTGPVGGIIFYVKTGGFIVEGYTGVEGAFDSYTAYYLEAALANATPSNIGWSSSSEDVTGTGIAIGDGKKNTDLIKGKHSGDDETNNAAWACFKYRGPSNKDDWFLPSKEELNQMYQNLVYKKEGHGFELEDYWSSSQGYNGHAWSQSFSNGVQYEFTKNGGPNVRAVRAF